MNARVDHTKIRPATRADLPIINDIYNHYVLNSTSTFQTEPDTLEDRTKWFTMHGGPYPVTVAETEGQVVAWASISRYHHRCAYQYTVEDSIYVREDMHGRGIGKALLTDLIERASTIGHHSIIASISADQPISIALHEKLGFLKVGCMREAGYKFNRWLDIIYMQKML